MKKLIIIAGLMIGSLFAAETEVTTVDYRFIKLSDLLWGCFPGLGIGYRTHKGKDGLDIDLTVYSYLDRGFSIYGKGHCLFYPVEEHFYLGVGIGAVGNWFPAKGGPLVGIGSMARGDYLIQFKGGSGFSISPTLEGLLGWEGRVEKTPLFLQLELALSTGKIPIYPSLSLGIGF